MGDIQPLSFTPSASRIRCATW
ncbi:hypothetical protein EYY80_06925 [Klebsiella oxytoca]|nr:hypothetical protein DEO52_15165 [Klebsiella pneumoniae]AWT21646.1 hypothetical protein DMP75_05145 [Klebsiella michiganensis]KAB5496993.1 hypothetical protein F8562_08415 [Klebsiella sp. RCJ4]MBZ7724815.1 hypothetical protein [Klebsiella oxytoca]MBK2974745.1 hypothetical protein [Klebsiella pneumoniae]